MQSPSPSSIYYQKILKRQKKLRDKVLVLYKNRYLVHEDMVYLRFVCTSVIAYGQGSDIHLFALAVT